MNHPYFDEDFKKRFVGNRGKSSEEIGDEIVRTELDEMLERDEEGQSALAVTK